VGLEARAAVPAIALVKLDPPSDTDIAHVVHQISQRVIRKLRNLGYLGSCTHCLRILFRGLSQSVCVV
jgi:hypothetical protein